MTKRIAVIGLAESGIGAIKLLLRQKCYIFIYDDNSQKLKETAREYNFPILSGGDIGGLALAVVSPGVRDDSTIMRALKRCKVKIISELELGYRFLKSDMIAVTGTNGKTSTTTLITKLLNNAAIDATAVGNIGVSLSLTALELTEKEVAVVEASSFQLDKTEKFRPHIAVLLNITPDHLDRHGDMKGYIAAKSKIFENCGRNDYAVINGDDAHALSATEKILCKKYHFSVMKDVENGAYIKDGKVFFAEGGESIEICKASNLGNTHSDNALATICVCGILRIPFSIALKTLQRFSPASYTVEKIYEKDSLKIFNDSKGTNTAATMSAIDLMVGETVLIMGGREKGEDYTDFFRLSKDKISRYIFFGENAAKLKVIAEACGVPSFTLCSELKEAFFEATQAVFQGNILFSPACASFDQFSDYKARGEAFNQIVSDFYEK